MEYGKWYFAIPPQSETKIIAEPWSVIRSIKLGFVLLSNNLYDLHECKEIVVILLD